MTHRFSGVGRNPAAFEPSDIRVPEGTLREESELVHVDRVRVDPWSVLEDLPSFGTLQHPVAQTREHGPRGEVSERSDHIWRTDALCSATLFSHAGRTSPTRVRKSHERGAQREETVFEPVKRDVALVRGLGVDRAFLPPTRRRHRMACRCNNP